MSGATSRPVLLSIDYEGTVSGLLDVVANKAGVWWKFSDGRVSLYKSVTKTFYLPAIARKSTGNGSITASTGSSGSSSSSGSGVSGSSSGSSGGTGGATSKSDYTVDVWGELEKTAETVASGATVIANASLGSLTVTGTPTQVHNVEEWAKSLADNLSQQVSITVHIYDVQISNEDNYAWNPSVVFNTLSSGLTFGGPQIPAVVSGLTAGGLTATVLKTATGNGAKYSGSQFALQALSTLGKVTETLQQTVVTLNGQPASIQIGNQISYLASSTPPAATAIGAAPLPPTLTPGQITTGFTASFLPRVVNGQIIFSMTLANNALTSMGSVSSDGASIQTPNVNLSEFQQSVRLTPGDSLLLTGLQKDNSSVNHSGVGTPNNYLLGGGVDGSTGRQLIAIVITAKVL